MMVLYISILLILDVVEAKEEFHRWDGVGVGENITLYDRESFAKFADVVGIEYEDYRVDEGR